jgi:hypothetical protein
MSADDVKRWFEIEKKWIEEQLEIAQEGKKLVREFTLLLETYGKDSKTWPEELVISSVEPFLAWRERIYELSRALLHEAEAGLHAKSIDGADKLIFWHPHWLKILQLMEGVEPPEVTRFLAEFKRSRGRMRSNRAQVKKYLSNPNWRAAVYAADYVEELRRGEKRKGPHKVQTPDGRKRTVHDIAVERAVKKINADPDKFGGRANPKLVKELLRRGRGAPKLFKW